VAASDVDAGDSLTITATTLPTWLTLTDNGDGTASLAGTPDNADVGTHSVALEVTDGMASDTQSFDIAVTNVNDAPVAPDESVTTDDTDNGGDGSKVAGGSEDGCGCASSGGPVNPFGALLVLMGLVGLRVRRRLRR
jgi:MYXO-CTERM domain-containing protein